MLLIKTDMMSILITNTIHIDFLLLRYFRKKSNIQRCDIFYYIFLIVSEIKFSLKKKDEQKKVEFIIEIFFTFFDWLQNDEMYLL